MRLYLNDASLQEQFPDRAEFEQSLRGLIALRGQSMFIRNNLRTTRSFPEAMISPGMSMRQALSGMRDRDLRAATLSWVDRAGPFVEDDRLPEIDDYFECYGIDVTLKGLGEAARRVKAESPCATYSFSGGKVDFAQTPLLVDHGIPEHKFATYDVPNVWHLEALHQLAESVAEPVRSWAGLFEVARQRFPHLEFGDLAQSKVLDSEPFVASIRDRSLVLMQILNDYVAGRFEDGSEGPVARNIIQTHFTGDRALFSGEPPSKQAMFSKELTFKRLTGENFFGHWHGKISFKFYRLHFEWPLEKSRKKLEIFYLGPKIAKS